MPGVVCLVLRERERERENVDIFPTMASDHVKQNISTSFYVVRAKNCVTCVSIILVVLFLTFEVSSLRITLDGKYFCFSNAANVKFCQLITSFKCYNKPSYQANNFHSSTSFDNLQVSFISLYRI